MKTTIEKGRCDLFGIARRRAVRAIVSGLQPFINAMETRYDIYNGYRARELWLDPYVLGFLFGASGALVKNASPSINKIDNDRAIMEALQKLIYRGRRSIQNLTLMHLQTRTPEFMQAAERGAKLIMITSGNTRFNGEADVIEAQRRARALGNSLNLFANQSSQEDHISAELQII